MSTARRRLLCAGNIQYRVAIDTHSQPQPHAGQIATASLPIFFQPTSLQNVSLCHKSKTMSCLS